MEESYEAMVKRVLALSAVLVTVATPEEVTPSLPAPLMHPLPTTDHTHSSSPPSEQAEPRQ